MNLKNSDFTYYWILPYLAQLNGVEGLSNIFYEGDTNEREKI